MAAGRRLARWAEVEELTETQARVLEAYFGLRSEKVPVESIGSIEIRRWLRPRYPDTELPSESLVRTVLARAGVPPRAD